MKTLFLILAFTANCSLFFAQGIDDEIIVDEPWDTHFSLGRTPEGEILTVAACVADSTRIYLYDMADRSIAFFDTAGKFINKINLESTGRATYVGDDFVVRKDIAIFINTVDKRLEYYNLSDGSREKSVQYPYDYFKDEFPERNRRIINRIFLDQDNILLGNSHALFNFNEPGMAKRSRSQKIMRSPPNKQILFYDSRKPVIKESGSVQWKGKKFRMRQSHFPLLGKSIAISGEKLITCTINNNGVQIFRTR